jgi:periodic tryptophan protein 1
MEYDLDHYDDDDDDNAQEDGQEQSMGMFANIKSLAYHDSNDQDPYITLNEEEEEDEEREELQILPTDNMLLAARIEDEIAHLEVYVYEDDADNLYVHHDIMLPAYPLCVEWLNSAAGKGSVDKADSNANFVAIGTMDPDIEIWDLDMVDCMYPNAILGRGEQIGDDGMPKRKKKKRKTIKANDNYHVDAVLSLAGNRLHRNLLASSSADKTIKLWDLHTAQCAKSYELHTDKVCSIAWHPTQATVLLSGSYDRTVTATDMTAPGAKTPRWTVESDVETVKWDPHRAELFYVRIIIPPPSLSRASAYAIGILTPLLFILFYRSQRRMARCTASIHEIHPLARAHQKRYGLCRLTTRACHHLTSTPSSQASW